MENLGRRFAVLALACLGSAAHADGARVPVLVELFSSEGCSSCPPADAALAELARAQPVAGAQIVPLEFHVDYWNRLGWADPFSSADYTQRQSEYAQAFGEGSVYTPQLVVDGRSGSLGNLTEAVASAAGRSDRARLTLSISAEKDLGVSVQIDAMPQIVAPADLWVAVTEEGLSTAVPRGENSGRTLRHAAVVRALKRVGPAVAGSQRVTVSCPATWKRGHLQVAVWVQERTTRRIRGAATASF